MNRLVHVAAVLLAGCSSFDEDVFASATDVSLSANAAAPDALADVKIALEFVAGPRASHTVSLEGVFFQPQSDTDLLGDEPPERTLDVVVPPTFDASFHPGEERTVVLVNIATTSAKLMPFCSMPLWLIAKVGYDDDDGRYTYGTAVEAAIACTP